MNNFIEKETDIRVLFGRNLKKPRTYLKLSQMALADETDLAPNYINEIEHGRKWASHKTVEKFAKALKVKPYQFFLNEADLDKEEKESVKIYLNDITDNLTKVIIGYRNSYLAEAPEETKNERRMDC